MKYVTFSVDGTLTGAYWQDIHQLHADHYIEVDDEIYFNWTKYRYINGVIDLAPVVAQPPVVPQSVTRGQFKLALLQMDLLDTVEAAIAASDRAVQINYAERLDFERNHPLVLQMSALLGKTETEVDDLFRLGATL